MQFIDGSITTPRGFQASGVVAGFKDGASRDLALIVSKGKGTAAAVFTKNQIQGHSLMRSRRLMAEHPPIHAVLVTAGNANCCVGPQGDEDAEILATWCAVHLGQTPDEVLLMATGIIGQPLPMETIREGLKDAVEALSHDDEAGEAAEEAILTTDTVPKACTVSFEVRGETVTMSGMAKGGGSLRPNMATLLAVITTDCDVDRAFFDEVLRTTVQKTFNRISIDGEMSPCDMVVGLASGLAGNPTVMPGDSPDSKSDVRAFTLALEAVLMRLARLVAGDGEGATKLLDVRVQGADTASDASDIARHIAESPSFRAAMFGEMPNWGAIMTAVGGASPRIHPGRIQINFGTLTVCRDGAPVAVDEDELAKVLANDEIIITVDLGIGAFSDHYWTCDLSYDYVKIKADYHS